MYSGGIDSLNKQELGIELTYRKVSYDKSDTVNKLRLTLRKAIKDKLTVDVSQRKYEKVDYANEQIVIKSYVSDLAKLVASLEEKPLTQIQIIRHKCKILHYLNRVESFMLASKESSHEYIKSWSDKLSNCLSLLMVNQDEQTLIDVANQSDLELSMFDQKMCDILNSDDDFDCNLIEPNESVLINSHTFPETSVVIKGPQCDVMPSYAINNCYSKLSNPVEAVLKKVPKANGLSVQPLLKVFECMYDLKNNHNVSDQDIYTLISNIVDTPLRQRLLHFKANRVGIVEAHGQLISMFIPISLKQKLISEHVLRPQFEKEELSGYIESVRLYNQILLANYTECELVENIVLNMSFATRTKLTLVSKPECFDDLHKLCVLAKNVAYNDLLRRPTDSALTGFKSKNRDSVRQVNATSETGCVQGGPPLSVNKPPRERPTPPQNNSKPVLKCYHCGKSGHVKAKCFAFKREQQSKNNESGHASQGNLN